MHTRLGSLHAAKTRAVALLCAVATLLVVSSAHAHAPMCDEQAQSIAAPPPIFPTRHAELTAHNPCARQMLEALSDVSKDSSLGVHNVDGVERAAPVVVPWPAAPVARRLPPPSRAIAPDRPGFQSPVYRPPRT